MGLLKLLLTNILTKSNVGRARSNVDRESALTPEISMEMLLRDIAGSDDEIPLLPHIGYFSGNSSPAVPDIIESNAGATAHGHVAMVMQQRSPDPDRGSDGRVSSHAVRIDRERRNNPGRTSRG